MDQLVPRSRSGQKVTQGLVRTTAASTTGGSWGGINIYVLSMKLISLTFVKSSGTHYLLD